MRFFVSLDGNRILGVLVSDEHPDGMTEIQSWPGWHSRPGPSYVPFLQSGQVVWMDPRTLAERKAAQIAKLKQQRDAVLHGGVTYDGSRFDSDPTAQVRVLGAYIASQAPGAQDEDWRLADNSWRTLTPAQVAGLWATLQSHVRGAFSTFQSLEAQVNNAQTASEVDAVAWP